DKNVPQTRRQECLRYIKVGTALDTAALRFLAAIAALSVSWLKTLLWLPSCTRHVTTITGKAALG
ncbi:MAG: hypothetical protein ABSG80_15525, partial [Verrucomicrobiota bacterium]